MAPGFRRRPRIDPGLTPEQREARIAELRAKRRARARKLARRSAFTAVGLALLVVVVAWWLLSTLGGRDFLLAQVKARLPAGVELSWSSAEGPARGPMTLHDVRFVQKTCPQEGGEPVPYGQCPKPGTLTFTARRIVIDPDIRPLLGKLLRLDTMIVEGATLDLPKTDSPFELPTWPEVLPDITPPLGLQADAIQVDGFRVSQEGEHLIDIRRVRGGLDARTQTLHLEHVVVDSDRGRFTAHGDYAPRDNYRMDLAATAVIPVASGTLPLRRALQVGVIARGDLEHLEVGVGGALPGQVRARLSLSGRDRPSWQLRASADKIDTALLAGADEASENPLSLQLQADGVGGRATLQGRFEQGDLHATVRPSKLVLEDKVLAFEPLVLDIFDGTITARGRGDFSDPEHATFRYATNARGLRFGGAAADPATGTEATPVIAVDADLGLAGTTAAWAVAGKADVSRDGERAEVVLDGRGRDGGMALKSLRATTPTGALDAHGDIAWNPATRWKLDATLDGFDPGYFVAGWDGDIDGTLATQGRALDVGGFEATLDVPKLGGTLRGRTLDGKAHATAHGEDYTASVNLALDRGRIDVEGTAGVAPRLHWDAKATLDGFDPGFFVDGWNGAVDANLASQGSAREDGGYDATVDVPHIGGQLRGRALDGHAHAELKALASNTVQPVYSGEVALRAGNSRIDAEGRVDRVMAIDARLSPLHLDDLLPDAKGTLRGTLRLAGPRDAPDVEADLVGNDLAWGDYTAAALTARGHLPWRNGNGALALEAQGVQAGVALDSVQVDARGAVEDLQLDARARGEIGALDLSGSAEKRGANWQGTLASLQLAPAKGAFWRLQSPAQYAQRGSAWTLSRSCFAASDGGALCASADWPRNGLSVEGQGLPLSLAEPYLPERGDSRPWVLRGEIALDGTLRPAGGAWQGHFNVTSADGGLRLSQRSRRDVIGYSNLALEASFDPQRIEATLASGFNGDGRIDARVATGWSPDAAMSGALDINTDDLIWLELFSQDIVEPVGRLEGHVTIAGTRAEPALGGQARLTGFGTELPALGIALDNGNIDLDALADGTARISGSVRSAPPDSATDAGILHIDGSLGWRGDDTPLVLRLHGDDVLVSNTRDLRASASPDITVRYAARQPLNVTGKVTVPSALIDLERLDQGVSASPDVVVLDPVDPEEGPAAPLELDLSLVMGDDVKLKGFGLDGTLGGQMRVRAVPGREMTATGNLEVGGRYAAYGQKLQIARGHLTWSNSPVSDPILDISATRRIEAQDITAGIDVTGRASSPQAKVWTDPATNDSEALSYLALGRSTSNLSSDENKQLNAATAALNAGGSLLAGQVGSKIGLDDAGVMESRALGGSVLGVGKQLSPRLYVGFGVSLLGTGQVLTLKYLLKKGFDVEIESSSVENRGSVNWRKEK
ncbi:translocation/assembly module TamB domain-containing protein [Luteimonas lutimaris]|uniref:Translocation and assembly module TamB C-terminal domain-containing protein n=1 Tax=Luteimonas lutimaris TaxID=698645 RepID=A0ABP7M733_9GAMM